MMEAIWTAFDNFRNKHHDRILRWLRPRISDKDEEIINAGNTCVFDVQYLGAIEVFESEDGKGKKVTREAMAVLARNKHPVQATLHVSGRIIRIFNKESGNLIHEQPMQHILFHYPNLRYKSGRGFSYICVNLAKRRRECHGFVTTEAKHGMRLYSAFCGAFKIFDAQEEEEPPEFTPDEGFIEPGQNLAVA